MCLYNFVYVFKCVTFYIFVIMLFFGSAWEDVCVQVCFCASFWMSDFLLLGLSIHMKRFAYINFKLFVCSYVCVFPSLYVYVCMCRCLYVCVYVYAPVPAMFKLIPVAYIYIYIFVVMYFVCLCRCAGLYVFICVCERKRVCLCI